MRSASNSRVLRGAVVICARQIARQKGRFLYRKNSARPAFAWLKFFFSTTQGIHTFHILNVLKTALSTQFSHILCICAIIPFLQVNISGRLNSLCLINLSRMFPLKWSTKCLMASDFRGSERNFPIGQSPKICGNFFNISITINKYVKYYCEIPKNANISECFISFRTGRWKNKK